MKRKSNKDRLRDYFVEHGTITRREAQSLGLTDRLSERVREFEAEGMKFRPEWVFLDGVRTSNYRYTLTDRPKPPPKLVAVRSANGVRFVPEEQAAGLERM